MSSRPVGCLSIVSMMHCISFALRPSPSPPPGPPWPAKQVRPTNLRSSSDMSSGPLGMRPRVSITYWKLSSSKSSGPPWLAKQARPISLFSWSVRSSGPVGSRPMVSTMHWSSSSLMSSGPPPLGCPPWPGFPGPPCPPKHYCPTRRLSSLVKSSRLRGDHPMTETIHSKTLGSGTPTPLGGPPL